MDKRYLHILEFDKITELLASQATSEAGKARCRSLAPMTDPKKIRRAQDETADALNRIDQQGSLSFEGLSSPEPALKRLEIGGILNTSELLSLCRLLTIAARAKSFEREERAGAQEDSLNPLFEMLEPLTPIREEIERCIVDEDEISDSASPGLHSVRRQIRSTNDRIHEAMNAIISSSSARTYLQDAVVTMRNGRYCLPVKSEYKNQFPGMIHDQSASGSTLFIEPMSVVRMNNDLKELFLKEKKEIEAVLADLSNLAAGQIPFIRENFRILSELDFIFAKAQLARKQDAVKPRFNTEGKISLRQARHPLLDPEKVVPIDVSLGGEYTLLIVTGPNTGGKTVSLKTTGLLTLMGQAGLHIPAADGSELAVFKSIFADIGDEQSIEQSLSTFSAHMTNIVSILQRAGRRSLVLLDELCAGTDPTEGAALAVSILDSLRERGIRAMATTHYSELKLYALSTEGVENASCEFDVDTLSPTYRLLTGIPGKSNAFAISGKLGLPDSIIDAAKERISEENENFEDILSDLEKNRRDMEKAQAKLRRDQMEAEQLKEKYESSQKKLNENRDKVLRRANEKAAAILRDAKEVADETIRDFNRYASKGSSADIREMEQKREKVRKKLDQTRAKSSEPQKKAVNHHVPEKLHIGDKVKSLSMNLTGTVHTLPDAKGNLIVQMGILHTEVNIKDLVLVQEEAPVKPGQSVTGTSRIKMSKSASISPELNIIGKKVAEALPILDKYLDDAVLAHLHTVRIVHGKGTGALRSAVHEFLDSHPLVKSYHLAEFGEGDAGVTVVEL